jgi:hypothetical protein
VGTSLGEERGDIRQVKAMGGGNSNGPNLKEIFIMELVKTLFRRAETKIE